MFVVDGTEDNESSEHLNGVDSAFFFRIECLERFLIMTKYLYEFADSNGERLADGLVRGVELAEFGG